MSDIVTAVLGVAGLILSAVLGLIGTISETRDEKTKRLTKAGRWIAAGIILGLFLAIPTEVINKIGEIEAQADRIASQRAQAEAEAQRFAAIRDDFRKTSGDLATIASALGEVRAASGTAVTRLQTVEEGMARALEESGRLQDQTEQVAQRLIRLSSRFEQITLDLTFGFPLSPNTDKDYIEWLDRVDYPLPFPTGSTEANWVGGQQQIPGTRVEAVGEAVPGRKNLPPVRLNISPGSPFFPERDTGQFIPTRMERIGPTIFRLRELVYNSTIEISIIEAGVNAENPATLLGFQPKQSSESKVLLINVPKKRLELEWNEAVSDPLHFVRSSEILEVSDLAGKELEITVFCPPYYAYVGSSGGNLSEEVKLTFLRIRFDGLHLEFDEAELAAMRMVLRKDRVWRSRYKFPSTPDEVRRLFN